MKISKNLKSFPKPQPVIDTLESLSEGHSFLLCDTTPADLISRDLLGKWNCQIKYTAKGLLLKSRKFLRHNKIVADITNNIPTICMTQEVTEEISMVPEFTWTKILRTQAD